MIYIAAFLVRMWLKASCKLGKRPPSRFSICSGRQTLFWVLALPGPFSFVMFWKEDRINSYIFLDFSPTRKGWSTNKIKIYLLMNMGAQGAIRNFKIPSALGGGMQKRAASPASIGLPPVAPWRCPLKPRHCKLATPNWIRKQEVFFFFCHLH